MNILNSDNKNSFNGTDFDDSLIDLELGFLIGWICNVLYLHTIHFLPMTVTNLETFLEAGNLYLEKIQCMVRGMREAEDDHNLMKEIVENGIYSSIRSNLSEGHEDKITQLFAAGY